LYVHFRHFNFQRQLLQEKEERSVVIEHEPNIASSFEESEDENILPEDELENEVILPDDQLENEAVLPEEEFSPSDSEATIPASETEEMETLFPPTKIKQYGKE